MFDLPVISEEPRRPFLVTGLPRSRTAWFAVACDCLHEPTAGDPDAAIGLWSAGMHGISDSGLSLHLEQILAQVSPRVLVIRRPRHEVLNSFKRYLGNAIAVDWHEMDARLRTAQSVMDAVGQNPDVRTVAYGDLSSRETVREAVEWLTGKPPREALAQLMHMNIQSDLDHNLALARAA